MRVFFHPYQLARRRGALLKVVFEDGSIGFSDCHPWPELGDLSLDRQLQKLKRQQTTRLTERSLANARIDAAGRMRKANLFEGIQVPNSHYLFMSLDETSYEEMQSALDEGFDHFKVKLGKNLDRELNILRSLMEIDGAVWRLDFNNRLDPDRTLDLDSESIDFIEDPFPCDERWLSFPYPVAADRQDSPKEEYFQVKIFKPAMEEHLPTAKPVVVTSYLGHPLGQAADAYIAGNIAKEADVKACGLLSHRIYPRNLFSDQLSCQGPEWKNPVGTGFGFDELLTAIDWQSL